MIAAASVIDYLKDKGYGFYSGVPCSILKEMLDVATNDKDIEYVAAVRENAALGVASGAHLAGKKSCVLMQNSGLGNIVNTLTSFNHIYKIPVIMFISWRGFEGKDAPEHIIMGEKMLPLLEELGIPFVILTEKFKSEIDWACKKIKEDSVPVAVIIKKGVIG